MSLRVRIAVTTSLLIVAALAAVAAKQAPSAGARQDSVADVVQSILTSGEHPGLKWGSIGDVTADLTPLYEAEPDRLLWFDGSSPLPSLPRTLAAIAAAGDHGLDP